jgi:serine/threonine-protein kinase RsbW
MPKIATISILDDVKLLPGILHFIDHIAGQFDFPQKKLLKFKVAYETMIADRLANAYQHGGTIDIDIILTASMLEVFVRDKGMPYWYNDSEYDPEKADSDAEGLESFLIANMCDKSGSEKLGYDGQRMFVQLNFPSPLDLHNAERQPSDERVPDDVIVSIRETLGTEKDIIAAITCIYDEYRYTYGYESLYYPENFKQLISAGKLHSFLAVGDNGAIAGHYCLSASDDMPGMPEWATVVVRHPFRGRHIFDSMCAHGITMASQSGALAIITQPTAYHTATQHVAGKYGYTATGFLFQYVYSAMESEYNTDGRRLDLSIAVKLLTEERSGTAYIPEEHSTFIKSIYKKLGAEYEFPKAFQPEQATLMKYEVNGLMKNGRVIVSLSGNDFAKALAHATGDLRRNNVEMVEMLINMSDPAAPFAYEAAKRYGYFFTGLMPGGGKGDYLVMQNLFWSEVDANSIAVTGEYAELLQYLVETVDCIKG